MSSPEVLGAARPATPAAVAGFRLSPQQRRLWRLQSLPGAPSYRTWCEVEICGPLDLALLRRALQETSDRHEILRTRFLTLPGMALPLQAVEPVAEIPLEVADLQGLAPEERSARLAALRRRIEESPFDPAEAPLVRMALVRSSNGEHRLLLVASTLYADAEGAVRIVQAFSEAYTAAVEGAPRADEPAQYADLAEWMNEAIEGEETGLGRERWRKLDLSSGLQVSFPGERAGRGEAFVPVSQEVPLPEDASTAVLSLARNLGLPVQVILQACWRIVLGRHLGSESLVIATAFDGRNYAELEEAFGLFSRYLPVSCRAEESLSVAGLLVRLQSALSEACEWQESFAWEEEGETPPFVDLAFSTTVRSRWETGGLSFAVARLGTQLDRYALELCCADLGEAFALELRFDEMRLTGEQVERLGERLATLLTQVARCPERSIGDLEVLSSAERQLLLVGLNQTAAVLPGRPVHTLFAQAATRTPTALAVVTGEEVLTFGELDRRANRLARFLGSRGVRPEARVGILLGRSCDLVVALLGVLKAGGAYVPIDPSYPADRLELMLHDAGCALLLTGERFLDRLAGELPPLVLMDRDAEAIAAEWDGDPGLEIDPCNLAYVIYTSGSTGRPKGVMITHGGLENYLRWCLEAYPLEPGLGAPVHSSLGFDLTVTGLFAPLLAGAAVTLVREERGAEGLAATLARGGSFGLVKLTPAHLELLSHQLPDTAARASRAFVVGGEQLLAESLAWWRERSPDTLVFNEYGPTETVVGCCVYRAAISDLTSGAVPIGRPVRNTRLYVVDSHFHAVPEGAPGELLIGGAGVARGYLGRGDLTAERFIPDPFGGIPGARLYRTGDLVCVEPDGELRFLGRTDHQVKIRGYRIEPGEIETVLTQHPLVREAAVVARPSSGGPALAAFLVPDPGWAGFSEHLRNLEREGHAVFELPDGMPVFHNNRGETEYLYKELFEDQTYLRHGIVLEPGACVFDVGANIGMFSLFVGSRVEGARIFAFEPIPPVNEVLRLNARLHGLDVRVFDCGVSDRERVATFSHFPHLTLISGRFADIEEETEVVRRFELQRRGSQDEESRELLDELLAERLTPERFECRLRPISDVIREERIERIDLLKIDVEKGEMEALAGITEEDWPKVRQVVVEVHDVEGRLAQVEELLRGRGFDLAVDQERSLLGSNLYLVYGRRPEARSGVVGTSVRRATWSFPGDPQRLVEDVRSFLERRLPEHMVPASLMLLPELPLTAHGKVDRRSLETLDVESRPEAEVPLPRTPLEQVLASLWREVLGREEIGRNESFFDLGGHSILVTRVISRVRSTFGVELSVRQFFAEPTIAGLAESIEEALAAGAHPKLPPIERVPREGALPLSPSQQRLWFLDQMEPGGVTYNLGRSVRLSGSLDVMILERAFGELIRRHEGLRTTFAASEDGPVQVIAPPQSFTLPVVDLSSRPFAVAEDEARRLAEAETLRPFDLAHGPLLRIQLLRLAPEEHVVVMTLHHIIADGWSVGVLTRELSVLYTVFSKGRPSPLPDLQVQYADYSAWQRRWLSDEVLERQLAYWRAQLANLPTDLVPTDRPRPSVPSGRGATEELALTPELSRDLRQLSRTEAVTVFMTILATLDVLLYHLSGGREDIVVGTNVAGRDRPEIEGLIGFFVNQLVLRTDLSGNPTFRELLARVRQVTISAYAHQDLPFERLVQALQPDRRLDASPLLQVKLEMVFAAPPELSPATGLKMSSLELEQPFAHLDLIVAMEDSLDRISAGFIYSTDLFEAATIQRVLRRFEGLLQRVAEDPEARLATLREWLEREDERERASAVEALEELGARKLRLTRRRNTSTVEPEG